MNVEVVLPSKYLVKGMLSLDHVITSDGVTIVTPMKVLTNRTINFIVHNQIRSVRVKFNTTRFPRAYEAYRQDAEAVAESPVFILPDELPEVKSIIDQGLKKDAIDSLSKLFDVAGTSEDEFATSTTAHRAVKELDEVVERLVEAISFDEGHSLIHMEGLRSHDEYTYHHSLSVAILSIAIGQSMSFTDAELQFLGRAAMLHDIGKVKMPTDIINKPSKLTSDEFAIAQNHPNNGYRYLAQQGIGDESLRRIVLCHHEKLDGSGYPNSLSGNAIPFMSRIIAVADIYDAVTSYRSYRDPMPPTSAIEIIMSEAGRALDFRVVKAFIEKIEFYPINTCVVLSNQRFGIVIDNANAMRPILRMLDNDEIVDLMNLSSLNLVITRVVHSSGI